MRSFLLTASDWIATVFRVGHLPLASGTWGSAVALLVWFLLPSDIQTITYWLILINLFLVGVITSKIVSDHDKDSDPSRVVIDEWVGMWIALAYVPRVWQWVLASFLLFRIFDIIKVYPARQIEKIEGGWGIMLDDVIAGVYTSVLLLIAKAIL